MKFYKSEMEPKKRKFGNEPIKYKNGNEAINRKWSLINLKWTQKIEKSEMKPQIENEV